MEALEKYITFIQYLKKKIQNERLSYDEISTFAVNIAKEIDRCKVNNEPCFALERLYEEIIWLKSEILI